MTQASTLGRQSTDAASAAAGSGALYDSFYYAHYCGERAYGRDPNWLAFFGGIAAEIVARVAPATVLDAGCAMGMVVEALRDRGVEAYGVDVSEYAIANAREDVRPFCRVGSILDPFPRRYDLIVCIEVLEHLGPREAERAVANFVASTDDVLFSSTPKDFKETTHFNVQPPEWWAELFARHGFYRDVGFDASFITPWAVRFRRLKGPVARVIGEYERRLWWLDQDNRAQRELGLEQRDRLAAQEAEVAALRARAEDLAATLARQPGREAAANSPDDELLGLRERLAAAERERDASRGVADAEREARETTEYRLELDRMRGVVDAHVPAGSTVLVVSGGDENAVDLPGRVGWHFPRTKEGWHAGSNPADGAEAAAHLDSLRAAGAGWLAFPQCALWWLESYPAFRLHLDQRYRAAHQSDACALFDLRRRHEGETERARTPVVRQAPAGLARASVRVLIEQLGPRPHSSSYVRLLLPLQHLTVARDLSMSWGRDYRPADVVIVERSWDQNVEGARRLVERARFDGATLIYSIDDNLLDLPATWFTPSHRAVVELLAREADGVVVSTEPLAQRMAELNRRVIVVPNALDERLLEDFYLPGGDEGADSTGSPRKLVLGYMGTSTHDDDLEMVIPALRNILRRHAGRLEFQLVGAVARPSTLAALEGLPVTVLRAGDGVEYPEFVRWMGRNVRWDVAIAPLRDTPLNRCKSDVKFLDYAALGVAGVYSRGPAYERTVRHGETGLLADDHATSWEENLETLVCDEARRRSVAEKAREHVLSCRTLRRRAHEWRDAIASIASSAGATGAGELGGKPSRRADLTAGLHGRSFVGVPVAREPGPAGLTALVVVPDDVNYFYAQTGRRLAEALRAVGVATRVRTLKAAPERATPDLCVMVNLYELAFGYGDEAAGYKRLAELARRAARSFAVAMDCAMTPWFARASELCGRCGVGTLLDLGLHDQSAVVPPAARRLYRFAFNGLTAGERARVAGWGGHNGGRPLPWVFVGHVSPERARLVRRLVAEVDPAGFVYLPQLAPYRDKGPHLNEAKLQSLLEHARFHVWCSHHPHFYMEGERFRNAALAGCLPLKVVREPPPDAATLPFAGLVVREEGMPAALLAGDFEQRWAEFAGEFLARPSLEQTMAGLVRGDADVAAPPAAAPPPASCVAGAA